MGMIVLDRPDQIRAFGLLALHGKMKLSLKTGLGWRDNPFTTARRLLEEAGRPVPSRSRAKTAVAFEAWLREEGVLS